MIFDPKRLGLAKTGAFATGVATILVLIVYFIAKGSGDELVAVSELGIGPPKELNMVVTVAATIAGGILGMAFAWLARRFTPRPRLAFISVSILGLILYGFLAFGRTDQHSTAIWLNLMHLAAALPISGALAYLIANRSDQGTSRARRHTSLP